MIAHKMLKMNWQKPKLIASNIVITLLIVHVLIYKSYTCISQNTKYSQKLTPKGPTEANTLSHNSMSQSDCVQFSVQICNFNKIYEKRFVISTIYTKKDF